MFIDIIVLHIMQLSLNLLSSCLLLAHIHQMGCLNHHRSILLFIILSKVLHFLQNQALSGLFLLLHSILLSNFYERLCLRVINSWAHHPTLMKLHHYLMRYFYLDFLKWNLRYLTNNYYPNLLLKYRLHQFILFNSHLLYEAHE